MRVLRAFVTVTDPDRPGFWLKFGPGTPASHQVGGHTLADLVPNRAAWHTPPAEPPTVPTEPTPTVDDGAEAAGDGPPPRQGRGSGRAAWVAYAAGCGVDVPTDATRDEIIEFLEVNGHLDDE